MVLLSLLNGCFNVNSNVERGTNASMWVKCDSGLGKSTKGE